MNLVSITTLTSPPSPLALPTRPKQEAQPIYYLGIAYEASHWDDQAAEQYRVFLNMWADADPGIVEVDDARKRLARLRRAP